MSMPGPVDRSALCPPVAQNAQRPSPRRRGRRSKGSALTETRDVILDVAEELFAGQGFHGVSIRDIAHRAGVNSALIHYYFDTKQRLFESVFDRRSILINKERLELLADYERRNGDAVTVEGAIAAFVDPLLHHLANGDRGWRSFFAIVAQVNGAPGWGGEIIGRYFDPVVQRLIEVMQRALPQARLEDLYGSYNLLSGALTLTLSQTGRVDKLSGGLCHSDDIPFFHPRLIAFAAAGFRQVCAN